MIDCSAQHQPELPGQAELGYYDYGCKPLNKKGETATLPIRLKSSGKVTINRSHSQASKLVGCGLCNWLSPCVHDIDPKAKCKMITCIWAATRSRLVLTIGKSRQRPCVGKCSHWAASHRLHNAQFYQAEVPQSSLSSHENFFLYEVKACRCKIQSWLRLLMI